VSEVLLLTGGRGHPPAASAGALAEVFADVDLAVDASDDVEAGIARLDPGRHALLAVNALHHTATRPGEEALRAEPLSPGARAAIAAWHDGGRPVLALHTGIICFDDWPRWAEILGGRWVWGRSHHPPLGPVVVRDGGEGFEVVDECYRDLDVADDVEVLATSADGDPLAWTRTAGGPTAVDLLGHDARSLDHPGHRRLLAALVGHLLEVRP